MPPFPRRAILCTALFCSALADSAVAQGERGKVPNKSRPANSQHFVFDVASIRENVRPNGSDLYNAPQGSLFEAHGVALDTIIRVAYGIRVSRLLTGVPAWAQNTYYDITAKSDDATDSFLASLSKEEAAEEKRSMLRVLLAERFHLKVHAVTRPATIYELVITPRAAKLMTAVHGDATTIGSCAHHLDRSKGYFVDSKGCPFSILFSSIEQASETDVVDHTGLSGAFAYRLMYRPIQMPSRPGEEQFLDIVDALREQLGLELKKVRGTQTLWVADSVERPTAN